jgi:hypothetical protein
MQALDRLYTLKHTAFDNKQHTQSDSRVLLAVLVVSRSDWQDIFLQVKDCDSERWCIDTRDFEQGLGITEIIIISSRSYHHLISEQPTPLQSHKE